MTDENSETNNSEEETLEDGSTTPAVDGGSEMDDLPTTPEEPKPPVAPRLSIAFPVVVAVAQVALIFYFLKTSTTPTRTYIGIAGAPVLATLLLAGWWMLSRTLPLRDRFSGLALAAGAVAVPLLTALPMDVFFLVYLLPAVTTSVVLVAAMTQGMVWRTRRKGLAGALALCLVAFCLMRVVGVNGNMAPLLGWRWSGEAEIASVENKIANLAAEATPEDWPGFRGATRDSRNMMSRFGTDWEAHPPKELWRRPVGPGWSSFTVVGDYFFTQDQRGEKEAVLCYETATGEQVWINTADVRFVERMGDGPRATPTFHKGKLYTQGATGLIQCLDASTGKTIWQRDLVQDGGKKVPTWGFCSSPLIVGDLVIAYTGAGDGKSVLAYRQDTGEIAWSAGKG
ncbi:MAG: PQQ-like beta-propeller repeat protein, partial [Candidatus Hydrogenedentes bacterium]|nr:PQQ-like beta-propeller repeat protein [Candidatus Hydrogenedentota bacterium]